MFIPAKSRRGTIVNLVKYFYVSTGIEFLNVQKILPRQVIASHKILRKAQTI